MISGVRWCWITCHADNYILKHHVILSALCRQWSRKLFTVWLLFNVLTPPILQPPLRTCHCHLHVFLQAFRIKSNDNYYPLLPRNKQIRTSLTDTKHCSQCTVGLVYCVQNIKQTLNYYEGRYERNDNGNLIRTPVWPTLRLSYCNVCNVCTHHLELH